MATGSLGEGVPVVRLLDSKVFGEGVPAVGRRLLDSKVYSVIQSRILIALPGPGLVNAQLAVWNKYH